MTDINAYLVGRQDNARCSLLLASIAVLEIFGRYRIHMRTPCNWLDDLEISHPKFEASESESAYFNLRYFPC